MKDDRLISLNAAIDALWHSIECENGGELQSYAEAVVGDAEDVLKALPIVDAVPVVRCKDCIRFFPDDDVWGWCTVSGKMRCKDYCSYGVREDGDHAEGTIQKERS